MTTSCIACGMDKDHFQGLVKLFGNRVKPCRVNMLKQKWWASMCLGLGEPGGWRSHTSTLPLVPSGSVNKSSRERRWRSASVDVIVSYTWRVPRVSASLHTRSMTSSAGMMMRCCLNVSINASAITTPRSVC